MEEAIVDGVAQSPQAQAVALISSTCSATMISNDLALTTGACGAVGATAVIGASSSKVRNVRVPRRSTGNDAPVVAYLKRQGETAAFLKRVLALLRYVVPRHEREGRSYLTVAMGCTGGRHRSVMLANAVGAWVRKKGYPVRVSHRDLKQG